MSARVLLLAAALAGCGERAAERPRERAGPRAGSADRNTLPTALPRSQTPRGANPEGDLSVLVDTALRETDEVARELAFFQLLDFMTAGNAPRVYASTLAIKPHGSQEHRKRSAEMRAQIRGRWAALDGAGAVAFGLEEFNGERLGVFLRDILPAWASADPESAIAWANAGGARQIEETYRELDAPSAARFEGSADHDVPHLLVRGIAESDLDLAAGYAARFEGDPVVHLFELFETVADRSFDQRGAAATLAWAEAFDRERLRHAAVHGLARAQARRDPAGAATWFAAYADQPWAGGVVAEIADALSATDPAGAARWRDQTGR